MGRFNTARKERIMATLRYSADATVVIVQEADGSFRVATQEDMDTLPVGEDLTDEELELLDD